MFRTLGPWEIGLVLVIVLIIFGVGKLPQVGGALGKSVGMFRKAVKGVDEEEVGIKAEAGKEAPPKT